MAREARKPMKAILTHLCLVALCLFLVARAELRACPLCQEVAVEAANQDSGDDPLREARAYNSSIYFMVSMPYLIFGSCAAWVYRGYRTSLKNAQAEAARAGQPAPV